MAPIPFIVGVGRSGTTLLRFMLDAHPQLAIPPETGFLAGEAPLPTSTRALATQLATAATWPDFQLSREAMESAIASIGSFDLGRALDAVYSTYAARQGKRRWGDKTPLYCLHMTRLQEVFPQAHFIHVIRDGRDVAESVRKLWFAPGTSIEAIAADWQHRIQTARAQAPGLRCYIEVRYEDLLRAPERTLRHLCELLELEYDASMLEYHARARSRLREHLTRYDGNGDILITHEQRVRNQQLTMEPPKLSRIGAWRATMSRNDQRDFEATAGELLRELGYATELDTR